jgi:hypothetical protein
LAFFVDFRCVLNRNHGSHFEEQQTAFEDGDGEDSKRNTSAQTVSTVAMVHEKLSDD